MPTANRRAFVGHAIEQFLPQDYPRRELIVVDDGEDCIADLIPEHDLVRYLRLDHRLPIGTKRNIACELAQGEVIAHWDDDDWMAPAWLASQVETLVSEGADICGLDKVLFYAPATRQGWRYIYDGRQPWICGGTLCYAKAYWARAPFRGSTWARTAPSSGAPSRSGWRSKCVTSSMSRLSTAATPVLRTRQANVGANFRRCGWRRYCGSLGTPAPASPSDLDPRSSRRRRTRPVSRRPFGSRSRRESSNQLPTPSRP